VQSDRSRVYAAVFNRKQKFDFSRGRTIFIATQQPREPPIARFVVFQ